MMRETLKCRDSEGIVFILVYGCYSEISGYRLGDIWVLFVRGIVFSR